jgi:hypothetical protein
MPDPDYKALCEELMNEAIYLGSIPYDQAPNPELIAQARAALAQPEPVAPTDAEIEQWADAAKEVPLEEMDPEIHGWRRCFTAKEFGETIRAALARWGTPANNTREENL